MNRAEFYSALRARNSGVFGTSLSQTQVDGINGILAAFETHGDGRRSTLAYGLATAYWETGRKMTPNRENLNYTSAERIVEVFGRGANPRIASLSEARQYVRKPRELGIKVYGKMLGNRPGTDDGFVYRGGGHMHLTGYGNYQASSADAGVDLAANPEAILDPTISGKVLFRGLIDGRWNGRGKGVGYYADQDGLPGLSEVEAIAARRTVNVQDKAAEIAGYYRAFDAALVAGGWQDAAPAYPIIATIPPRAPEAPASAKAPLPPLPAPETKGGLLAAILRILARIFGGKP
jgi:predicted chitinase